MEIVDQVLRLIASLGGLILTTPEFRELKFWLSLISLLISFLFIYYWFYLEKKSGYGRDVFKWILENISEASIPNDHFKKQWVSLKKVYLLDRIQTLRQVYKFLKELINFYGYPGEDLIEQFKMFPDQILTNKENFLKALEIITIIEERAKNNQQINMADKEVALVLYEIEKGLKNLLVINLEDQWAEELIPPLER